ncbi:MAG: hypothetical protein ACE5HV_14405, partial [Acidobacteriota bacterium]
MRKDRGVTVYGLVAMGLLCFVANFPRDLLAQASRGNAEVAAFLPLNRALQYRMIGPYRGGRSTAVAG